MDNLKALPSNSQGCSSDVLYYDANTRPTELYEAVTFRLESARDLLEVMAAQTIFNDSRALPVLSGAAAILLSDASAMLVTLYDVAREHEQLNQVTSATQTDAFIQ
ncbi:MULTISPECIES: hypothetical protein [Pseudomonas]|uniref:hypothetical protein n=1 Tax=Pseudomonas TaxID=286 RepID=UPI001C2F95F0|nr:MULTISPECIES: hypothetical protein [Pseudomonas]MBV2081957.1 hypothetical protein [Pseudomonas carnis]MBV2087842.1 hypothetical protein [Pseudomonas carnis]MDO3691757.1 hypothetical protein [Pseudomonas sp. DKN 2791]MDO7033476.1 hypothetical protein [Pseudomonas sp. DKN 2792]